ncbi:uncharacterized protein LOC126905552 isoform X2 [Daktulosphaira vitifoliae]|nr:uncharacterized protein LOC126905552 isoform X2 [Daktulosphaira vitifoliae]
MIEFVPMAKFMKGALYAIEKYHNKPLNTQKKFGFLLSKVLTNLQKNESLKKMFPLKNNKDSIKTALVNITEILQTSHYELNDDIYLCKIKQLGFSSLWNFWINEYVTLKCPRKHEEFIIFLSDKINNLFLTTIWKKYVELGFKFDSNTSETFLPALPHTNVKQGGIAQNSFLNMTQHTNEVDMMENIQQKNIVQNTSILHNDVICETEPESGELIEYPNHLLPFNRYL